jgi:pimeloyl-ACP methyl ester carboxylesterase
MPLEEELIDVGDVRLHVVSMGQGAPVVLLHGFPEYWYSWRHQMTALADAGYRVIAPDLRGFNLSDKPAGVASYQIDKLVGDVRTLLQIVAARSPRQIPNGVRVDLVGHDWGGTLAWYIAAMHPELLGKLAILNSPHPKLMAAGLRTWSQRLRSSYMLFFLLPSISEWVVRSDWFMESVLRDWAVQEGAFTSEDVRRFGDAMRQPGAATATLNWYRAALRFKWPDIPKVRVPTLVIWGEQDRVLGRRLLDGLDAEVETLSLALLPNGSHWVQQDCPDAVSRRLLTFLASNGRF